MLNYPGDGRTPCGPDNKTYTTFASAGRMSEKILHSTDLEEYIVNVNSLNKPIVLAKIWRTIDATSMDLASGRTIEQVRDIFVFRIGLELTYG